ncbi:MAG TPA: protein kinase [Pyrinomonadaceae bacterium]|jgi:serine/threonine-protein kinase|nr:protein kinase [Pyrinomonadaceae bacterium]
MSECLKCGTATVPNEAFCSNCGTKNPVASEETTEPVFGNESMIAGGSETIPPPRPSAPEKAVSEPITGAATANDESHASNSSEIDSAQLGGASTGEPIAVKHTIKKGNTGGHQPTIKQLDPGNVLNHRYEIVRRIGGGGMGAVYLAKDRNLGDAPRAVKEMVEAHLDPTQHEKAIGDFKRESLLLTSLEHPSIPTIYDYFYDEPLSRFYLVMKFISGGDLASRLRTAPGGRIDERTVCDWGMQAADVLEYLHSRPKPIIYRDLKPANLMIDGNSGRVMLIDFGIARWVKQEEKGVTAVGTMGYAPPELFGGRVEPRSDVYSLGATLFHLLTGSDPQDNPLLIFDFQKNPRPRQIAPAVSSEMEQILMRSVEYKPEDRFHSAGAMRDALAIHLERIAAGQVTYGATATQIGGETVQVQTVYCGFCGGRIAADDIFCAHCGARQPMAGVGSSATLRAARPTAKLVVAGTTELDASFVLQKDNNLLGRTDPHSNVFPEIDLSKFDPETKVSRRHARIWREGETFLVEDLGSVNGTVINDSVRLAPRQPRVLDSGDKLRLGETTLHFLLG